jgi:hypothetical protein
MPEEIIYSTNHVFQMLDALLKEQSPNKAVLWMPWTYQRRL